MLVSILIPERSIEGFCQQRHIDYCHLQHMKKYIHFLLMLITFNKIKVSCLFTDQYVNSFTKDTKEYQSVQRLILVYTQIIIITLFIKILLRIHFHGSCSFIWFTWIFGSLSLTFSLFQLLTGRKHLMSIYCHSHDDICFCIHCWICSPNPTTTLCSLNILFTSLHYCVLLYYYIYYTILNII